MYMYLTYVEVSENLVVTCTNLVVSCQNPWRCCGYRYRSAIALVFAKRDLITICDYYNTRYSVCHDFLIADLTTHTIVRFLTDLASRRARVALTSRPSS